MSLFRLCAEYYLLISAFYQYMYPVGMMLSHVTHWDDALSMCVWSHVTHWDDALSICKVARSHLSSPNWSWDEPPKVMGLPRLNGVSDALGGEPQMPRLEAASWSVVLKSRVPAWLHCLPISAMGLRMDNKIIRIAIGLCLV